MECSPAPLQARPASAFARAPEAGLAQLLSRMLEVPVPEPPAEPEDVWTPREDPGISPLWGAQEEWLEEPGFAADLYSLAERGWTSVAEGHHLDVLV